MKTTYTSDELPHQWAHQLSPRGTCPQNMSFEGVSFRSYYTEIARIINRNGRQAFLVAPRGSYSVTTSKHQGAAESAIPHGAIVFECPAADRGGDLSKVTGVHVYDHAIKRAARCLADSKTARTRKDQLLADYADWLTKAGKAAEYWGLKRKADPGEVERLQKRIEAGKRKQAREDAAQQAAIEKENAKVIKQWLAGKNIHFPSNVQQVRLRVTDNGNAKLLETSRGVAVPIEDAERAFRFVIARKSKGWHRNGEECKVGEFQLDAVNAQGVVAGCHRIDWDEIERFAKLQGWTV